MLKFIVGCQVCDLSEEVEADSEEVARRGFQEHHQASSPSCPAPCFSCNLAPPEERAVLPSIVVRRKGGEPISFLCP